MLKELIMGTISQDEILNNYNATIFYKVLPKEVYGYVFYYKNIYCIVINKYITQFKKKNTLIHELAHIELNHLCQCNDLFEFYIESYEDEANIYVKSLLECE